MTSGGLRHFFHSGYAFRSPGNAIGLILLVLVLGLALRLFAWQHTGIVNSDGTVYIHQARAVYYGLWDSVNSCTITYPSITTLCIAAAYPLFGDWVIAGTAVSLFLAPSPSSLFSCWPHVFLAGKPPPWSP